MICFTGKQVGTILTAKCHSRVILLQSNNKLFLLFYYFYFYFYDFIFVQIKSKLMA